MNLRPSGLQPSKALTGFLHHKMAEGLSPNTLRSYEYVLKVWASRMGDKLIEEITADNVREFLAWLRTEYKPRRTSGSERPLSPKSLHNAWIALCAFFTWASKEFKFDSPMKGVPAPKFEYPPIEPFTKEQIETLLKASEYMREANTDRRKKFAMR
jgi:integrase/recombinase XerD